MEQWSIGLLRAFGELHPDHDRGDPKIIQDGDHQGHAQVRLLHRFILISSLRRTKFPVIYPELLLGHTVAACPRGYS